MSQLDNGEVGSIARHGLRLFSAALEAANDTAKFVQLMTLLEYLADPDRYISMQDVKKRVGRHIAKDRSDYDAIMQDFRVLTSMELDSHGRNNGLRHNIVHLGANLEELLDRPGRRNALNRLSLYAGVVLACLIERSAKGWEAIEQYHQERGFALGLEKEP